MIRVCVDSETVSFASRQADDGAEIRDGSFMEILPSGAEKKPPDETGKASYVGVIFNNTHV